jgi:RNA polymerase sigma factor (sigma-70 family)
VNAAPAGGPAAPPGPAPGTLSSVLAEDLVAYRGGDPAAAGRLARRATPFLWHVARSSGADPTSAEDAVQNALLMLVRKADTIREPRAVLQWLVVTVRREVVRLGTATARTDLRSDADLDVPAPRDAQPEEVHLTRDRDRVLWGAVGQLPERCRQLLRVIAFADRPDYAAIAQALGMPLGSIGPTRGRCLAKLRTLLSTSTEWSGA